ncbi:MAG: hypothetical protein CEN91_482, partial [Candidatus Berkelbacteria bacterium Licking1014_85]
METDNKYHIIVPKICAKEFKKIPKLWLEKIAKAINLLETDPFFGQKLWGKLEGKRKIRIPPYRIIYFINTKKRA